jgi:hypothetical protein
MIQIIRSLDVGLNEDGILEGDVDNYLLISNNDYNIPWSIYAKQVKLLTEIYKGLK